MKKEVKLINEKWLNLACGQVRVDHLDPSTQQKDGTFFGIDVVETEATDAIMNLEWYPWNIESESAEEIICSHYVEHVTDLIKFMDEVYRILKPTGKISVVAPYYTSVRCWQDPTHKRAISEMTFMYFNKGWRDVNKLDHYGIKSDFDFSYGYSYAPEWENKHIDTRTFATKHYWNVINDIHVVLTKRVNEK